MPAAGGSGTSLTRSCDVEHGTVRRLVAHVTMRHLRCHATPTVTAIPRRGRTRSRARARVQVGNIAGADLGAECGHRGRNAQPDGGRSMFGGAPGIGCQSFAAQTPADWPAGPACRGGSGVRKIEWTSPRSTGATGVHDLHPIGDAGDDAEVVGDEDHAGAELVLDPLDHIEDLGLHRDIECGGRLVGDQHVGVVGDGDGDHDALTHATRELVWILPGTSPSVAGCRRCRAARPSDPTPLSFESR